MIADFSEASSSRVTRWVVAGALVVSLHCAVAAAAMMKADSASDDDIVGAMLVELASVAMAPQEDRQDLAIGERADDSEANPPPLEDSREPQPEDLTQTEEPAVQQEPDLALPAAKPGPKVEEAEPLTPQEPQPSPAAVSSVAAAPPPIEAPLTAPVPTAPAQGNSQRPSPIQLSWQKSLLLHLNRHKRYPSAARRTQTTGTTLVSFRIDRSGMVTDVSLVKGSGSGLLDSEALELLRRASPLPSPPGSLPADALAMIVPVQFSLK